VICVVEQPMMHVVLTLALPVAVAAPVGAVPGTTQPAWQVAAAELQTIMQFVVVEVCARRIFSRAVAGIAVAAIAKAASNTVDSLNQPGISTSGS
jgi:hypothetical protein